MDFSTDEHALMDMTVQKIGQIIANSSAYGSMSAVRLPEMEDLVGTDNEATVRCLAPTASRPGARLRRT